jgi:phthalate 4,5-dioxygenase
MLSNEDNERMCRVGPGTPMGKAMRYHWLPALSCSDLPEPDGDPVQVELLGQSFVAFRDSSGKVGLLDELCLHRATSLTIGRVESGGIRCIYHGWVFSTEGEVLETPNVIDPAFKSRLKARAYPVREAGGLIWAYLGDGDPPPLPDFPWMNADPSMRLHTRSVIGCNYVQLIEGLIDSAHLSVLHKSFLERAAKSKLNFATKTSHMAFDVAPVIGAEATDFGMYYSAVREVNGEAQIRIAPFMLPFWVLNPNGDQATGVVPLTDEKSAFYTLWWDGERKFGDEPLRTQQLELVGRTPELLDTHGFSRTAYETPRRMSKENGWHQDRSSMKDGSFSGLSTLTLEDAVVGVTAGTIRPRDKEMLCAPDVGVAMLYRSLLKMCQQAERNERPGSATRSIANLRGIHESAPVGTNWKEFIPKATQ